MTCTHQPSDCRGIHRTETSTDPRDDRRTETNSVPRGIRHAGGAEADELSAVNTAPPQPAPNVGALPLPRWPVVDSQIAVGRVVLECGVTLPNVAVRIRLEGDIAPARDNVVLVVHALTGTPEASNWWRGVIGNGAALDPSRHAILCANLLGGCAGTTGPRADDTEPFPALTTRDQAAVLARVLDVLAVDKPLLVCGGSLGGMVTLEFAASFPDRVRQAVVLAAPAAQTAQGLAWNAIMRQAIAVGGAQHGLALARMVGMLSYRTAGSFEERFGRQKDSAGSFKVTSWLEAHADKLVRRFDPASYGALINAMDAHDVGRGRGGVPAALRPVAARLVGVGIPGDLLYAAESVRAWCENVGAPYEDLPSRHGHDGFLMETERVSEIIARALEQSASR